jgi:predicted nucleic acid-binding protein
MKTCVVDASVAVKWFFPEQHTASALRLLDQASALHAPDILLLEVDSVICKRIRRREIDAGFGRKVRAALRQFPVCMHETENLLDLAFELAVGTGRAIYDCVYLALAAMLETRLVTADRRLYDALKIGSLADRLQWVASGDDD